MNIFARISKSLSAPKNSAAFTAINMLLGVGPIILPGPFFRAGFFLSFIWMAIILFVSFSAALFVAESMKKVGILQEKAKALVEVSETDRLLASERKQLSFDHMRQFSVLYGQSYRLYPALVISFYLLGVSISKCIMTGNTLSKVFKGVDWLEEYTLWLIVFFISGAVFAFKSIEKTKVLQTVIVLVRVSSILMMIVGAIIIMIQNGTVKSLTPKGQGPINIEYFNDAFSNFVFSFLFHHSIPGITAQLEHEGDIFHFLRYSFITAGSTMILVPFTGILAFGDDLISGNSLKYYNYEFQGRIDFIYYFVSFYVFLNIAAFSVYIIIIRTNILAFLAPKVDPRTLSKQTLITSGTLLLFIVMAGYFLQDDIQIALNFTSAIFGSSLLFLIPSLEVIKARKMVPSVPKLNAFKRGLPYAIMVLGILCIGFSLYQTITKLQGNQ